MQITVQMLDGSVTPLGTTELYTMIEFLNKLLAPLLFTLLMLLPILTLALFITRYLDLRTIGESVLSVITIPLQIRFLIFQSYKLAYRYLESLFAPSVNNRESYEYSLQHLLHSVFRRRCRYYVDPALTHLST